MIKTQEGIAVGTALTAAARRLEAAGVASARLDARLLLSAACSASLEALAAEPARALREDERLGFEALLSRRLAREPMARILGKREFWSLPFRLAPETLVPRPESETLVEAALALVAAPGEGTRILDLGTGSGCLLLAFLSEREDAEGVGVDVSEAACRLARANAAALGLSSRARFVVGDWDAALCGRFDLVLANPPYVKDREIASLAPEVARYEPRLALAGGADGLACYRELAPAFVRCLAAQGHALIELGAGQADAVGAIMAAAGLHSVARRLDLAGNERCLIISLAPPRELRGQRDEFAGEKRWRGGGLSAKRGLVRVRGTTPISDNMPYPDRGRGALVGFLRAGAGRRGAEISKRRTPQ